jgi:hypothetical protein
MSIGLWYVGMELGGGGRWRGECQLSSRDMSCWWTRSGEGRTWGLDWRTRRSGDQPWWLTPRTSISVSVHESDRVDQVKTTDMRVERFSGRLGGQPVEDGGDTCRVARDAYGVCYLRRVSRVWTSKPRPMFRGGTDGMWRHQGARVEAKLPYERRCGRRMKTISNWIRMPLWLTSSL